MSDVICPKCDKPATASTTQYGVRHDCCGLWSWGGKPLVSGATHAARKAAHVAFDKLWKRGSFTRGGAYAALAEAMKLTPAECHIAQMTKEQAERVVSIAPKLAQDREAARVQNRVQAMKRGREKLIGLDPWCVLFVALFLCVAGSAHAAKFPERKPLPQWFLDRDHLPPIYFRKFEPAKRVERSNDFILRAPRETTRKLKEAP